MDFEENADPARVFLYNRHLRFCFLFMTHILKMRQFCRTIYILFFLIATTVAENKKNSKYLPTWDSIDSRSIPEWYDDAKIGVKVSWGVSSVPGFRNEWFWHSWQGPEPDPMTIKFMQNNYPPRFTYQDFARDFTAEFFDPNKLADILKSSGAKYVVFTSKHHDGYALYPSRYSFGWNSMDTGPRRDLIKEFSEAIRNKTDIRFGLYHSLYEWFHPLYLKDKERNFRTRLFVTQKIVPEFKELVNYIRNNFYFIFPRQLF